MPFLSEFSLTVFFCVLNKLKKCYARSENVSFPILSVYRTPFVLRYMFCTPYQC